MIAMPTTSTVIVASTGDNITVVGNSTVTVADKTTSNVAASGKSAVVVACTQGPRGLAGFGATKLEIEAGEDITFASPIKVAGNELAYIASNLVPDDIGKVIGLAFNSAISGELVEINTRELESPTWTFSEGLIFLGDRVITQAVPTSGFYQQLGAAESPNKIIVNISQPFKGVS